MRQMRARTPEDQEAVRTVLAEFFTAKGGYYTNKKLSEIYAATSVAHERRKNAGSKGGKAKAMKTKQTEPSNAVAKPKHTQNPESEPYKLETNVSNNARDARASGYTDEFEIWWQAYPKKTGKDAAFRSFQKAKAKVGKALLFEALNNQLPQLRDAANKPDGNYCPNPATWLNQGRYHDEVSAPREDMLDRIAKGEDPWTNASENVLPLSVGRLPRG